jgi:hypothetical protein
MTPEPKQRPRWHASGVMSAIGDESPRGKDWVDQRRGDSRA